MKLIKNIWSYSAILGAMCLAFNISFFIGYAFFTLSSICGIVFSYQQYKFDSVTQMNATFLIINLVGLVNFGM